MSTSSRRSLKAWREARKMTHEAVMRQSGVQINDLKQWESAGYPTRQGGPGKAIKLADVYDAPLDEIDYGPHTRAFTDSGYDVVLATNGRDDRGWESFVAEFRSPDRSSPHWRDAASELLTTGARTNGATAKASLDTLETAIRSLIAEAPFSASAE